MRSCPDLVPVMYLHLSLTINSYQFWYFFMQGLEISSDDKIKSDRGAHGNCAVSINQIIVTLLGRCFFEF
jgi:hypothetical protein